MLTLIYCNCGNNPVEVESVPKQSKSKILFCGIADGQYGLYKIFSDGTNINKISDFQDCWYPKLSRDETKIFYLKGRSNQKELFVMDSLGENETKLVEASEFVLSPDGGKICYIYGWEIYCCDLDGSNIKQLTNTKYQKFGMLWSPINSEIVFTEIDNIQGTYENIYRINIETENLDTLITEYDSPRASDWSKDGTYLLFSGNHAEVFKLNLITNEILQLTNANMRDEWAVFSPDGLKILFNSDRENITQVYMMNSDGSNQHKVSKYPNGSGYPQWSPDGTSISYLMTTDDGILKIIIANSVGDNEYLLVPDTTLYQYYFSWFPYKQK